MPQFPPDETLHAAEAERYMNRLEGMAYEFEMNAVRLGNSPDNLDIASIYKLLDHAHVIHWALKQIRPSQRRAK